jgi:hypothetical protein
MAYDIADGGVVVHVNHPAYPLAFPLAFDLKRNVTLVPDEVKLSITDPDM